MFDKLDKFNSTRKENARQLSESLNRDSHFTVPGYKSDNCPVYLRLPVLAENRQLRDSCVFKLKRSGITATKMYPDIISHIPELKSRLVDKESEYPGAAEVAERLFTLPTHYYLRKRDIETILYCLTG